MLRYVIVSLVSGLGFGILDGLINANPLAAKLFCRIQADRQGKDTCFRRFRDRFRVRLRDGGDFPPALPEPSRRLGIAERTELWSADLVFPGRDADAVELDDVPDRRPGGIL